MYLSQKTTIRKAPSKSGVPKTPAAFVRERIIRRVACEFRDGMYGILYSTHPMKSPFKEYYNICMGSHFKSTIARN